jgi:type 1 glutamine amidotransferase
VRTIVFVLVLGWLAGAVAAEKKTVLIFGLTKGFRHGDAIAEGSPILKTIAEGLGYNAVISEDPACFDPEKAKQWDLIIFNNTTGDLFPEPARRTAFIDRIQSGGAGFIGLHSAADCFYNFPEYGEMLNGWFAGHPWNQKVTDRIEDPEHPLMKPFGGTKWEVQDEIYQYRNYDRAKVRVLMIIDTRSVDVARGGRKDRDYAMCWIRPWGKGRVVYQGHGHGANVFKMKEFQEHMKVAMQWAIGDIEVDTTPSKVEEPAVAAAKALAKLREAQSDPDRSEALDLLSMHPAKDALPLVVPLLDPANKLAPLAADATLAIITSMKGEGPPVDQAIDILKKALACSATPSVRKEIRKVLQDFGVTNLPLNVPPGFIAHWWVAGPLPNPGMAMFEKAYPPETAVDLEKGFEAEGKNWSWKHVTADDDGILKLDQAVARADNVGAYMYAEVTIEKETPVQVLVGSDDGFVAFLNGERIGGVKANRGIQPGQDKLKATLRAGVNRVLMKVLNGGADWAGCMQIVGPNGEKVEFAVRDK